MAEFCLEIECLIIYNIVRDEMCLHFYSIGRLSLFLTSLVKL